MPPQAVQDEAPVLLRVQEKPVLHVGVPPKPPVAGQHASPLPPQAVQDCIAPVPVHAKPVSQVPRVTKPPVLWQQTWPPAPQASHMPPTPFMAPTHRPPGWHTAPAQHAPPV